MPSTSANITLYATCKAAYDAVLIASGTAANAYTLITTGGTNGSIITDILFRSADAARSYNIIICPTGSNTSAQYNAVMVSIPASSGNNGSTAQAQLSALAPQLFDIDLAGNRVLTLESGISIYVQNTALTTGAMTITAKRRDY